MTTSQPPENEKNSSGSDHRQGKTGARELLVGTEDQPGLLQIAARMIRSGDFYGNPKSQTCNEKYCPVFNECRWRK